MEYDQRILSFVRHTYKKLLIVIQNCQEVLKFKPDFENYRSAERNWDELKHRVTNIMDVSMEKADTIIKFGCYI